MNPLYNKGHRVNPIVMEYGISQKPLHEGHQKIFQRKQQPRFKEQILYKERKKRENLKTSKDQICFLSSKPTPDSLQKITRCKSNSENQNNKLPNPQGSSTRLRIFSGQAKTRSPAKIMQRKNIQMEESSTIKKTSSPKKFQTAIKFEQMNMQEEKQINELRKKNQQLTQSIAVLKIQLEHQETKNSKLNDQIRSLTEKSKQSKKKLDEKTIKIRKLEQQNQQQRVKIQKLDSIINKKEDQLRVLISEKNQKEQLERVLSQMNQNFDDFFTESKANEYSSGFNSNMSFEEDPRYGQIIGLQEKVKYQDIQISMLKKFRYEHEKSLIELEKIKAQNNFLVSKLKNLPLMIGEKYKTKFYEQFSVSFQLSKDQINV